MPVLKRVKGFSLDSVVVTYVRPAPRATNGQRRLRYLNHFVDALLEGVPERGVPVQLVRHFGSDDERRRQVQERFGAANLGPRHRHGERRDNERNRREKFASYVYGQHAQQTVDCAYQLSVVANRYLSGPSLVPRSCRALAVVRSVTAVDQR